VIFYKKISPIRDIGLYLSRYEDSFILSGHVTAAHVTDTTEFERLIGESNLSPDSLVVADKGHSSAKNRSTLEE
jgi:IS5 family transposase